VLAVPPARRPLPGVLRGADPAPHRRGRRRLPAPAARFPDLRPLLAETAEDHVLISGIVARIEEVAASGDPALAAELDGLAAIVESHFAFEERRIREALDALDGSAVDLLGAQENSTL
jgi:hypothetical protein